MAITTRELNINEYKALYKENIVRDFPVGERRPLASLKSLKKKGNYKLMVLEEDGHLLAYAGMITGHQNILLDYFAVIPERRGQGIGGNFLQKLIGGEDADGMIIECENPDFIEAPEGKRQAEKRIEFYHKFGVIPIKYKFNLFGVEYKLFWLPITKKQFISEEQVINDLLMLYTLAIPPLMFKKFVKYRKESNN